MLLEDIKKQREYEKRLLETINKDRAGSTLEQITNPLEPGGYSSRGGLETDRFLGEERLDLTNLNSHRVQISEN